MNRREALGLILLGGLIAAGRAIRRWLLLDPAGNWREPGLLAEFLPGEPAAPEEPPAPEPPFAVNHVGVDTLVHLPGVGPVLAARIVQSRRDEGPFLGAEDLKRVKGIGPKLSQRLSPLLRFHVVADPRAGRGSSEGDTCR